MTTVTTQGEFLPKGVSWLRSWYCTHGVVTSESESKFLTQLYKLKASVDEEEEYQGDEGDKTGVSERFSPINTTRVHLHAVPHFFLNLGQLE